MNANKRILPLLALAAVVLLAMTGCDKILETMFPVETGVRTGGGGTAGTNTVNVSVTLPTAGVANFSQHDIYVKLERTDGSTAPQIRHRPASLPPGQTTGDATMSTQFDFLSDGGYHVTAWLEMNGNGQPDPNEPQGAPTGGREYFTLPDGNNRAVSFTIGLIVPNTSGQNTVTATVKLLQTITGWNVPNSLMMTLENLDGVAIYQPTRRGTATPAPGNPTMGSFTFTYSNLVGGSYHAYAWLDLNGNLLRDADEPQGVPVQEYFGLPVGGALQQTSDIILQAPSTGTNTVTATVRISMAIPGWNTPNWLMMQLERQNDTQIYQPMRRATAAMDPTLPTSGVATFTYSNVPGGTYRAYGWLDINGDGMPTLNVGGVNEPYGIPNTSQFFTLPTTGSSTINLDINVVLAATGGATMNWNVHVDQAVAGWNTTGATRITLQRVDGQPIANSVQNSTAAYDVMNPTHGLAAFTFSGLADGYYNATAWVDTNGDQIYNNPTEFGQVVTSVWVAANTTVTQDVWINNVVTYTDIYEPDNSYQTAKPIGINAPAQVHYLDSADQDWMYFYATAGTSYVIATHSADTSSTDTVMELYEPDGTTLILSNDDSNGTLFSTIGPWTAPAYGYYYVRVTGYFMSATGAYTVDVITQ
jgi:uncharacterized protein (DUF2141 family)